MITSADLLDMSHQALTALPNTTEALDRVYLPGDWPTQPDQYPIIRLQLVSEDRQSLSRSGAPEFTTTATMQIVGEVSYPAEAGNAGAAKAGKAAWALKRQIEVGLVNAYPLTSQIQQFTTIRSSLGYDSSGATHIASVRMDVAMEFYEGADSFAPVLSDDIDVVETSIPTYPPAGLSTDFR